MAGPIRPTFLLFAHSRAASCSGSIIYRVYYSKLKKKSKSLDNTLFCMKKNRVLGDFRKNVGQLIDSAVGLLENLPYHIFKTESFVTVNCTHSIPVRL